MRGDKIRGIKQSPEHIAKRMIGCRISQFKKGNKPWNKGLKTSGFKNRRHSLKNIRLFSERMMKSNPMNDPMVRKKVSEARKKMIGELSPRWKNGITRTSKAIRNSKSYKIWRSTVLERDNYLCQNINCVFCNNKNDAKIDVHHIKSFALFPELRFEVSNGIVYCRKFHSTLPKPK